MAISRQSSAISKEGVLTPKPVACNNTQKRPSKTSKQKHAGGFEDRT